MVANILGNNGCKSHENLSSIEVDTKTVNLAGILIGLFPALILKYKNLFDLH